MIDVMLFIINLDFFFVSYYVFFCLFFIIFFFLLSLFFIFFFFFFFQAEDGIRDLYVTGVQTCALPISRVQGRSHDRWSGLLCRLHPLSQEGLPRRPRGVSARPYDRPTAAAAHEVLHGALAGRAGPARAGLGRSRASAEAGARLAADRARRTPARHDQDRCAGGPPAERIGQPRLPL